MSAALSLRRIAGRTSILVLLGMLFPMLMPAAEPAGVRPGQVAVSTPDATGMRAVFRPFITRLHQDDPLKFILHAEPTSPKNWPLYVSSLDALRTLASLRFDVVAPTGESHSLTLADVPQETVAPSERRRRPWFSSLVLTFTSSGIRHSDQRSLRWANATAPDFRRPGVYRISVAGTLHVEPFGKDPPLAVAFKTGPVEVHLGAPGELPRSKFLEATRSYLAQERLAATFETTPDQEPIVRDTPEGHRVVPVAARPEEWQLRRYHVTWTADAQVHSLTWRDFETCLGEGTPVDGEHGPRPVEDLAVGERVWSIDLPSQSPRLVRVTAVREGGARRTTLRFGGLRLTPEHPVYVDGEFRPAGLIRPGDRLLHRTRGGVSAEAGEWGSGAVRVFDVSVESPHVFFAAGLLVHNKMMLSIDESYRAIWPPDRTPYRPATPHSSRLLGEHPDRVTGLAFAANGRTALSYSSDGSVTVWDVPTGARQSGIWSPSLKGQQFIALSPDGERAAFSDWDWGQVRVWNPKQDQPILKRSFERNSAMAIAFTPDGTSLAVGGGSGSAWLWNLQRNELLWERTLGKELVNRILFSADGNRLAYFTGKDGLWWLDASTGKHVASLDAYSVEAAEFSPEGRYFATCISQNGRRALVVYRTDTQERRTAAEISHTEEPIQLRFDRLGRILLLTMEGEVLRWSGKGLETICQGRLPRLSSRNSVVLSHDGRWAVSSEGSRVRAWEIDPEPATAAKPSSR